jgi:hypothetical protein
MMIGFGGHEPPWYRARASFVPSLASRVALLAASLAACDQADTVRWVPAASDADAGPPGQPSLGSDDAGSSGDSPEPAPALTGTSAVPSVAWGSPASADAVASGLLQALQVYCGDCHSNGQNGAGFAKGLDLASLIESGLIVPGSSATSPILQRIVDGTMPPAPSPPAQRQQPPTAGDIALLTRFIDALPAELPPLCEPLPFLGLDAAYSAVLADLHGRPEPDRPFLRYVGIAQASNARRCGAALDQQRQALSKLVNSLSTSDEIHVPTPIDGAGLLFRIDIRDYGWAHEIDLEGDGVIDHADGWEAVLSAAAPYGVPPGGPDASALAAEAHTNVPFLPVNAFVRAAAFGDVYYALVGIRPNVYDTMLDLGLDPVVALDEKDVQRAALSRHWPFGDAVVTRYRQGEPAERSLWQMDVMDEIRDASIFDEPAGFFRADYSQTLFELPNGLHAYSVNDGGGERLQQRAAGCIESCDAPVEHHAVACMGCHTTGLLPVEDIMAEYLLSNRQYYDDDTYARALALYPPAADFAELVSRDNEKYLAALERAGVPAGASDPVSAVYLDFDTPLDLERAAAELGVRATDLSAKLGVLPEVFARLGAPAGTIERAAFSTAYVEALCVLHERNRPVACP